MLKKCERIFELYTCLKETGWCLGQGFYYKTICFINQSDGGNEWLAIHNFIVADSHSFERIQEHVFYRKIEDLLNK